MSNVDASSFLRGLNLADIAAQRGARRGFALCLAHGEKLAKGYCPIDQSGKKPGGTLAATIAGDHRTIEVSGDKIEGKITAGGGEASDYAIKQHEDELNHTHPVAGTYASQYITKALAELAPLAPEVIADEIRKELKS